MDCDGALLEGTVEWKDATAYNPQPICDASFHSTVPSGKAPSQSIHCSLTHTLSYILRALKAGTRQSCVITKSRKNGPVCLLRPLDSISTSRRHSLQFLPNVVFIDSTSANLFSKSFLLSPYYGFLRLLMVSRRKSPVSNNNASLSSLQCFRP